MKDPGPDSPWCACVTPVPMHEATRKGAARSVCARCGKPLRLRLA